MTTACGSSLAYIHAMVNIRLIRAEHSLSWLHPNNITQNNFELTISTGTT
jgi:hypothetical protein